jgi:hypothetical protein
LVAHSTAAAAHTTAPAALPLLPPPLQGEELDAALAAELAAVSSGLYDARQVSAIVKELMADDDEDDEAELPALARRNPVVAAAAVSGARRV